MHFDNFYIGIANIMITLSYGFCSLPCRIHGQNADLDLKTGYGEKSTIWTENKKSIYCMKMMKMERDNSCLFVQSNVRLRDGFLGCL